MARSWVVLLSGFLAILLPLAAGSGSTTSLHENCHPTYREMPAIDVKADGAWDIEFEWLVIGCASEVSTLSEQQVSKAVNAMEEEVKERSFTIEPAMTYPDERDAVVERLREESGARGIEDIFLFNFLYTEHSPLGTRD